MELVTDREVAAVPVAHRVTWFIPDRPVNGGTVFKRPDEEDLVQCVASLSGGGSNQ